MSGNGDQQNTVYVVDSNFLICFDKWVPQSHFPKFWNELERTLQEGKWILLDIVVAEVSGEKSLKKWCEKQKNAGLVTKITDADKLAGAQINNDYPMIDVASGRSENDTYLLAHAKANGYGVVSDEVQRKNGNELYKIPDVCAELNIIRRRKASAFFSEVGIKET